MELVKLRRRPRQPVTTTRAATKGKGKKMRPFGWAGAERICLGKVGEMAGAGVVDPKVCSVEF